MKKLTENLLRVLFVLCLTALLSLPILAFDLPGTMNVEPVAEEEMAYSTYYVTAGTVYASQSSETAGTFSSVPTYVTSDVGVDLIIGYEGFIETKQWDVSRYSIGYGSDYDRAVDLFPEIEILGYITEEQARAVMQDDLKVIEDFVNYTVLEPNGIVVNQNQFDALVSLTYNVGSSWWYYVNDDGTWCLLKQMLLDDPSTWTEERTASAFGTWRTANGVVLEGLVIRRAAEAALFSSAYEGGVFTDVPSGKWYYTFVMAAYESGIMVGNGDGTFGPEDELTRGAMVQALAQFSGADLSAYKGQNGGFNDVDPDIWYASAVAWASENGIVQGYGDGTFDPDVNISRQDLCNIMARYLRNLGITAPAYDKEFVDEAKINPGSLDNVYYCAALGLVEGVGDDYFDPTGSATRAQAAKILVCMSGLIDESTEAA